jgi:hypothetical protein
MKILEGLKTDELKTLKSIVSQYGSMEELVNDLDTTISRREEEKAKSLNVRFNMDMFVKFNVFDPWELNVLKSNNISNMQELIDCNLDELVGITSSIKRGLEWARKFYDMSSMEEIEQPKKK